jgi:hypothetical protein
LDRIALSLGANTVAAAAGALLPVLLADADWKQRHAALITIAQVAEGCVKVFVKQTDALTGLCLQVSGFGWWGLAAVTDAAGCCSGWRWLLQQAYVLLGKACCLNFVVRVLPGPWCPAAQLHPPYRCA